MNKFLLPLLLLSLNCIGQDTTYTISGFSRITSIYGLGDVHKKTTFDTVNFAGAFIKMQRRGDVYYIPSPIADTILRTGFTLNIILDTVYGTCGPSGILIDTVVQSKTESMSFMNGITGFYVYDPNVCPNKSTVDQLILRDIKKEIPEKKVKPEYWDYKKVSYTISIVKKQATYSN